MIPMQRLALEEHRSEHGKDNQHNHFLNHLELHQRERTSVLHKADAVGRNLEKVFKEGRVCPKNPYDVVQSE